MDEPNVQIQILAASDTNSEESARNENVSLPLDKRICLVGNVKDDILTCRAAQEFGVPVLTSETGIEYVNDVSCTTIFVLDEFESSRLNELRRSPHRILGSIALQQLAEKKEKLPQNTRPLFNLAMIGVVVCFTGFRKKEDLTSLIPLIHHMGGSIRKDMVSKVTHLIANCCGGDKYQYATTFKVPVMSQDWVINCWEQRKDLTLCATLDSLTTTYKLKPFYGARVCFYGFSNEETKHMHEVLEANGGTITKIDDPLCTHVVMENGETYTIISPCTNPHSPLVSISQKQDMFTTPTESANMATPSFPCTSSPYSDITDFSEIQQTSEVDHSEKLSKTIHESPQKRRRDSPDNSEFELSFKRRRNSSFISSDTSGKRKFKDILKTPVSFFNRRRSTAAATITSNNNNTVQDGDTSSIGTIELMEHNEICSNINDTFESVRTDLSSTPVQINNNKELNLDKDKQDFKLPVSFITTPKHKSFFKKGFRKSFMSDKSALKNITEPDPNCSIDDYDVSICESVKKSGLLYHQDTPTSLVPIPDNADAAGPDSCGLSTCSIRVVDESSVTERPEGQPKALLVKAEWFWASVQNVACADEKDYLFDDYLECVVSPGRRDSHATTPGSSSRRKRKRLHETLSSLVRNDSPAIHKRRSSVSDAGLLSVSGSFLDCTTSPDKDHIVHQSEGAQAETPRKNLSPRQQVFLELIQTESNYVNILQTITTMFKSHLEDMPESEALLNNTELKIIFGNLPPIYETHSKMLEELRWASGHWSEDTSVGNILLKYSNDLLKAYPPFVNFFEAMKEMLTQCDLNKPRFHAFLKVCQTRPECGRQSLQDLLIRPVQRLPSISLLLNDILKHTNKSNPDHAALELALSAIKEVMTHINEDKRKTEGQRVMFDIFNEIDNCPPDLVSSHRTFITRCEVTELSDGLSGRGNPLVLFLFTDQLEVCKKRSKAFNTLKSPNTVNGLHSKASSTKPYKHVCMMALNTIKRVIDIKETEDCQKVFALVTRDHQELKEKLFSFTMTEDDVDKSMFLKTLCRNIANTAYSADAEKFLAYLEPQQLDIDTSDVTMGTLSKAFKFATRTRIKVGRAFSFNKTPSKLKRAMSTMMSPFGSSTNITPASQLANMRLASYNNINELGNATDTGNETSGSGETLVAPMSVQPTRKLKCSSLSVTALKRL